MDVIEAYNRVLRTIIALQRYGVPVESKLSRYGGDADTIARYAIPGRLPPGKWIHVTFNPKNQDHAETLFQARQILVNQGIFFDSGGFGEERDWELDWSFHVDLKPASKDAVSDRVGMVEELIRQTKG